MNDGIGQLSTAAAPLAVGPAASCFVWALTSVFVAGLSA